MINRPSKWMIAFGAIAFMTLIAYASYRDRNWSDSIRNPENQPYVLECAFNLDIPVEEVTQLQFNERYLK